MSVDIKHARGLREHCHPVPAQRAAPLLRLTVLHQQLHLVAQSSRLRNPVKTEQLAPLFRWAVPQRLDGLDPANAIKASNKKIVSNRYYPFGREKYLI